MRYQRQLQAVGSIRHLLFFFVVWMVLLATPTGATADESSTPSLHQLIQPGCYRITQISAAPTPQTSSDQDTKNTQTVTVALQSIGADPSTAYTMNMPLSVTQHYRLHTDSIVHIKHRIYGLLLTSEENGNKPIYLVLDAEWEKTNAWKRVE